MISECAHTDRETGNQCRNRGYEGEPEGHVLRLLDPNRLYTPAPRNRPPTGGRLRYRLARRFFRT